jgi:glycosyltransferase involved in cell wall biosynthesis
VNVTVCIPATRPDTIGAAVRSIVKQTHDDWEVLVVAQGPSTPAITQTVREALGGREGRVIADDGRGVSRARNVAMAAAEGDVIALIDDDCEAAPNWLEVAVGRLEADPRLGLVAGALVAPPKGRRHLGNCTACLPDDVRYDPAVQGHQFPPGFFFLTANVALRRSAAEAIGGFDEFLGPGGRFPAADDDDFQYRAVERGVVMQATPESVVHHTYGWRYGARTLWGYRRDYARGGGAFAAKLTLLDDPHGAWILRHHRQMAVRDWLKHRRPAALPTKTVRYYYYAAAYKECLSAFSVDHRGFLRENMASASA